MLQDNLCSYLPTTHEMPLVAPQHDDNQECPLGGRPALGRTIWVKGHSLKFGTPLWPSCLFAGRRGGGARRFELRASLSHGSLFVLP